MPLLKGEELSSKSTQTKSPARTSLLLHLAHCFIDPLPQLSFFVIVFLNSFSFPSLIFKGLWQRDKRFLPSFPTPTPLSRRSINIQQGPEVQTAERLGENRATPIHNGFSSLFHLLSVGRCCRGTTGTKWEMQRRGGEGEERGWELERERETYWRGKTEKARRRLETVSVTRALNIFLICLQRAFIWFKMRGQARSRRWQELKAFLGVALIDQTVKLCLIRWVC